MNMCRPILIAGEDVYVDLGGYLPRGLALAGRIDTYTIIVILKQASPRGRVGLEVRDRLCVRARD